MKEVRGRQEWTVPSMLQDRGSYDSSIQGDGRLPYHDTREVTEPGLCGVCEVPQGTVG